MAISDGEYRPGKYRSWIEEDHIQRIQCSAISRDRKWLVAVTAEYEMLIFQATTEELTTRLSLSKRPNWVSISDSLNLVLVGYVDGGFDARLLPSGEVVQHRTGISETEYLLQGSVGGVNDAFLLRPEESK